jgi:hypothetical protein
MKISMSDSHPARHQPAAKDILDDQVIRIKRGRLNKFGFEPAWNAYYDFYLSNKYLKQPIIRLEDVAFHLFMRKNLNDDDPTWRMPSFRMMKKRLGVSQDKIEGMLERLARAHLLNKISGKRKGKKGADIANTYVLSDPIQNLQDFLTVAAAGQFSHPLKTEWKSFSDPPVPISGTAPHTDSRYGPVPVAGTHKHTSLEQTSTTNNVVERLVELQIRKGKAQELAASFSSEQIEEKIELLEWRLEQQPQGKARGRPIEDPAAWLIRAIENDYKPPSGFKTRVQREQEAVRRDEEAAELARQETERFQHQQEQRRRKQQQHNQRLAALKRAHNTGQREGELWDEVVGKLEGQEAQVTRPTFNTMLEGSALLSIKNGEALIALRHQFARHWVDKRLTHHIQQVMKRSLSGREVSVKFVTLHKPGKQGIGSP